MERFKEILRNIGILTEVEPVKPKELPLDPGPCKVFTRNLRPDSRWDRDNPPDLPTHVVIEQDGVEKRVIEPFENFYYKRIKYLEAFDDGHIFVVVGMTSKLAVFHKDRLHHIFIPWGVRTSQEHDCFKISPDGNYLLFAADEYREHVGRLVFDGRVVHILRLEDMKTVPISENVDTEGVYWHLLKFDFSKDGKEVEIDFQTVLKPAGTSGPVETTKKNIPIKEESFDGRWDWYYRGRSSSSETSNGGGFMGTGQQFPSYFYRRD